MTGSLPHIWLAYVPYPVTTAVYLERALRRCATVTSVGPPFPPELIETWHLQSLKLPFIDPDLVTPFIPDMTKLLADTDPARHPDLYLWVESVGGYFPENIKSLTCPTACYLIDTHLNLSWHLKWAQRFDFVFLAQREYVDRFRAAGLNAHWLPLACDPEIHAPWAGEKQHALSFVGSLSHNPRRQQLLKTLEKEIGIHCERCWWDDMARVISASRITFNNAVKNDLNMRVFEALSIGTLLLTDQARESGQELLFKDGEELAVYRSDSELVEVARFYLDNPLLQQQIAARGQKIVQNAHTYTHRVADLLAMTLGGQTETASAEELRERSLAGLDQPFADYCSQAIQIGGQSRSFVIPVLDYSPASPYSITTLLADLENIPGDLIVIFNNESVADELKGHPRITRYAIMKENIGVARAWNVGIAMATTPHVLILNADLHLEPSAVQVMEQGLETLERAACTGPQGSFVDYHLCRDFLFFDKGTFDKPVVVDAVSGFLFAVKRNLFGPGGLQFENAYTPCYFEEWDLGLQIRQLGLASWIVPTSAYQHHWGGSIGDRREIACLGRNETPGEILQRNRLLFLAKWRAIAGHQGLQLPESKWREFGTEYATELLQVPNQALAETVLQSLSTNYPDDPKILALEIACAFRRGDMKHASQTGKRLNRFAPWFELNQAISHIIS